MNDDPESKPTELPVVVFGLDKERRPRAGTFPAELAPAAAERAKTLNLVVKSIEGPTIGALAKDLKVGDLAKEGFEFIPTVIRAAYERLLVATGVVGSKAPTAGAKGQGKPSCGQGWRITTEAARVMARDRRWLHGSVRGPQPGRRLVRGPCGREGRTGPFSANLP